MARIALIGLGMVSGTYAAAIADSPDLTLAAICATRPQSADAFRRAHPALGPVPSRSLEEIAQAEDVDFAILATPPDARLDLVRQLTQAKCPILMEKPVARTLAEARDLVALCAKAQVPLGIVLQHRARPAADDLRAVLPDLGPLCAIEISVPWWRPQSYYDAPGRGSYARDGGGVLISQAIHTLDLMLHLAGPVAEVTAMAATTDLHRMEAEDFVTAGLRFASGAVATLFATTAAYPGRGERLTFHGKNGSARLEAGLVQIDWQDGRQEVMGQAAASGAGADPMAFTSDWHRTVIEDFAEAVAEERPPMIPGEAALAVHGLIDALERSARAGTRVSLET